ncbi:UvrD-helicase domain-containing protein, partial [Acinetobacter sp. P8-3-8]|uniref:UvrD-helicase domain-containing protein n=1 Tax=Acinetobacter sp. P8-3-8 TaxID=1029823 RepID=UPI00024854F7
ELDFTSEQNLILDSRSNNIIISACAGAGKSSTLIEKANREIKYSHAWKKIVILTFTNKSKNDLTDKIKTDSIIISTFHGFIFENIFPFDARIVGELEESFRKHADTYSEWLNILYNKKIILGSKGINDFVLQHAIKLCEKKNLLNFIKSKFHAIYIDEAQDNNFQQYELIDIFIKCGIKILMVGDPNQTLYSFRGANADRFLSYFKDERFENYVLNRNFRCHSIVNEIANSYAFPEFDKHNGGEGYIIIKENQLTSVVRKLKYETIVFLKKTNESLIDYDGKFSILKDLSFDIGVNENIKKVVISLLKMKFQRNYYVYNLEDDLNIDIDGMVNKDVEILRRNLNEFIKTEDDRFLNEALDMINYDDFKGEVFKNYIFLEKLDITKNFFVKYK